MRLLLLLVLPAILHAHPQRQLHRNRPTLVEDISSTPSRGNHKYDPGKDSLMDVETWRSERTERRKPSTDLHSSNRRGSANRRSDVHEPEPASSVLSSVTQQFISPRRSQSGQHRNHNVTTESTRRSNESNRHSRTRSEHSSTESSRRYQSRRREFVSSTELPKRSNSRKKSTTESPKLLSETSTTSPSTTTEVPISQETTNKSVLLQEAKKELTRSSDHKSTDGINEENDQEKKLSHSEKLEGEKNKEIYNLSQEGIIVTKKESNSQKEETLGSKRKELSEQSAIESTSTSRKESVSYTEEASRALTKEVSSYSEAITAERTKEVQKGNANIGINHRERNTNPRRNNRDGFRSSRRNETSKPEENISSGRNLSRSQTGRKLEAQTIRSRTSGTQSDGDSISSANTREYKRRHTGDFVLNSNSPTTSHSDIKKVGARQRTTISSTDTPLERASKTTLPRVTVNREEADAQRSRTIGRREKSLTTTTTISTPRGRDAALRRSSSRGTVSERKGTQASTSSNVKKSAESISDETLALAHEHEMFKIHQNTDDIKSRESRKGNNHNSEDSFITRSSHQVVTVTAYPYDLDQNLTPDFNKRSSRGKVKANNNLNNEVPSKPLRGRTDPSTNISKQKHRTANLLVAPSPPSSSAENNVDGTHQNKVLVVGGYSRLRTKSAFEGSTINEDNNKEAITSPFTRVSSRKEKSSTASRGKPFQETLAATVETHRQVATPSTFPIPKPTISHAGRTGFKQQILKSSTPTITTTTATENYPPNFPTLIESRTHASYHPPVSRKTTYGHQTTLADTGITKRYKAQKDVESHTNPSFRRSIGSGSRGNLEHQTTEVSVVTSQSVPSNIPRFSSRYRTDLLRATGHGVRATTTPAYVPTVPTVRPTVSTSTSTAEPGFSETPPDALNLLDDLELSTSSNWKHTVTPRSPITTTFPQTADTTSSGQKSQPSISTSIPKFSKQSSQITRHLATNDSSRRRKSQEKLTQIFPNSTPPSSKREISNKLTQSSRDKFNSKLLKSSSIPITTESSKTINLSGKTWLPNIFDLVFQTTKMPLTKSLDAKHSRFQYRITAAPKGTLSSTTPRVVRVREVKFTPEPTSPKPSTTISPDGHIQKIPPKIIQTNNIQPRSATETTSAPQATTTTTSRTPVPYVIFGIYPNGTVFRKLPNSNIKEQVHENEISRRNPYYPDQRYPSSTITSTTSPAPSSIALQAQNSDDASRNEIPQKVQEVPGLSTPRQQPSPTPMQTSGFALGTMISNALGIDPQSTLSGGARTTFLANVVRNSNIITTSTTTTTTSTTTTTTSTTTPAPSSSTTTATTSSPSTAVSTAQPNTTPNSVAGALEDFTLLNALLVGHSPNDSPRPGRDKGSSLANRIIEAALSRGSSTTAKSIIARSPISTQKPSPTPKQALNPTTPKSFPKPTFKQVPKQLVTQTTAKTLLKTTSKPKSTSKPASSTTVKTVHNQSRQQEDLAVLLKLIENMEPTTKANLNPSEQLLADFLVKQATSHPTQRNLRNQNVLNTPPAKTTRKSRPPSTTSAPGLVLSELFGPLPSEGQSNKIRDPRAGQGLVEAAINATKAVSQLMGSVIQGATKSFQSFMKSLASGSGAGSG